MSDGTGFGEALLGLDGFRILEVTETEVELVVRGVDPGDDAPLVHGFGPGNERRRRISALGPLGQLFSGSSSALA